ncbi:MAG: pyruvate:ferredoxin (flavodoxin) oxidoreductase [Sumerlaeia bacterium]
MTRTRVLDANEAVARVAYAASEVIAIYPITPSSSMGEHADAWGAASQPNLWGAVPQVVEMESETGAAGAVHGALQTGALTTTFTASQGLLLMIPNMYKIAGELTPFVMHVAARSVATHALSIFGDHSDVMAARQTGFAQLCSASVQEAQDFAAIAHAATLAARLPFLHFFDGFRTSHELATIEELSEDAMRRLIDPRHIQAHRRRGMTPDRPDIRGTAQNPDVFFQSREAANPYYIACPLIVQGMMDAFAQIAGRQYHLFDYVGAPDADRVIVMMGSACTATEETIGRLRSEGEKVGLLKVRLFRPFSTADFLDALPRTVKSIAVLDRTKEPGAVGEPLFQDVASTLMEAFGHGVSPFETMPRVIRGRYGLSSKEFTPAMAKAVYDELASKHPLGQFTVGITDDVTHMSLAVDPAFCTEADDTYRAVFFGLGSDGTVGATKNTIKILGNERGGHSQGFFVYDSKKSGSMTTSHLRFSHEPINSSYLISEANFVSCSQWPFVERVDILDCAAPGAVVLLNSHYGPEHVWDELPAPVQQHIVEKKLRLFTVDAFHIAKELGLGRKINTVMQAAFFAATKVLPLEKAVPAMKALIAKSYGKLGPAVVEKNCAAVDQALEGVAEVAVPDHATSARPMAPPVSAGAPEFVRDVLGMIIAGRGDSLPVSALPADGNFPCGTTQYEKRNIAQELPVLDPALCIQCGKCVMACPHAAIRAKLYDAAEVPAAPETFKTAPSKWPERKEATFALQVAPEDCTGCQLCAEVCPAKDRQNPEHKALVMVAAEDDLKEREKVNWEYFLSLPQANRGALNQTRVKDVQLLEPLFEFSGACSGCGETPYLRTLTQLFGDRMMVANATGCSSIFGGNLPTTPWRANAEGRGPAWANSLFEDNAEFGLGMRVALDQRILAAIELLKKLQDRVGAELAGEIVNAEQATDADIAAQRQRVVELRRRLADFDEPAARELDSLADSLVRKSVWIVGGDGWAYDIGFGGLDHVLASGRNVNVLVLDTEVYSNTGGQSSKATPRGAVAKFAASGKPAAKKDLALQVMSYGTIYVARISMGANDAHTLRVLQEAESYNGPSLVLAYAHCIAHGMDLCHGFDQQKAAVATGHWPLLRFDPRLAEQGKNPLQLDSKAPKMALREYTEKEGRYQILARRNPERSSALLDAAEKDIAERWRLYHHLASLEPGETLI